MMSNLIIQSHRLTGADVDAVSHLVKSNKIKKLTEHCYKILDVIDTAAVAAFCAERQIDYAFMPAETRLEQIGLLAIDMDSTLINIECIDEIAALNNLRTAVSAITEKSMRGEIDFTQSLYARVALLAGLPETVLQTVYESRLQLNSGAEYLFNVLHEKGIYTLLISGGFTYFTERLKARLQLREAVGNQLAIAHGKLTGQLLGDVVDGQYKANYVEATRVRLGLHKTQVIAVGDGANDVPMLRTAGYGIAFRGKPIVQQNARLAINYVGLDGILALFGYYDR